MSDTPKYEASTVLDEILALSASMLDLAQAQDWIAVANLEATRDALFKSVFEGADRPSAEALTDVIRQVLKSDRVLIALGEHAHGEFVAALEDLRQGRRALAAYSETGGA